MGAGAGAVQVGAGQPPAAAQVARTHSFAVTAPDWGGLFLAPRTPALAAALNAFVDAYYANGDAFAGSNGPGFLRKAGCERVTFTATVGQENPAELGLFAAAKLTAPGHAAEVACLRAWAGDPDALFAQVWGETIARRAR